VTAAPAPRACASCGLTDTGDGHGATFTGYVHVNERRVRYSRYCDACRARARGFGERVQGAGHAEKPVDAETAARFLRLAREYLALSSAEDDPVTRRRLARAANDYATMAGRRR